MRLDHNTIRIDGLKNQYLLLKKITARINETEMQLIHEKKTKISVLAPLRNYLFYDSLFMG